MPRDVKVMIPTAKAEEVGVRNIIDKQSAEKSFKVFSQDETEMEKIGINVIEIIWKK